MNILTVLTVAMIAVNVLVIYLGFIYGYRRGTGRSLVRFAYILIISAIAYFLAIAISKPASQAVLEVIRANYNDMLRQYAGNSALFEPLVRGIIAAVLAPVIFPLIFIIFQVLSMIKFRTVADKLVKLVKKNGDPMTTKSRVIGGCIGLVQSFIIATALIVPLSFAHTIIANALYTAEAEPSVSESALLPMPGIISLTAGRSLYVTGSPYTIERGSATTSILRIYSGLTSIRIEVHKTPGDDTNMLNNVILFDDSYNLMTEGPGLLGGANSLTGGALFDSPLLGGSGNMQNNPPAGDTSGSTQIAGLISSIIPYIQQSEMLSAATADLLNTAATIWESGESFLGITLSSSSPMAATIISSMTSALRDVTPESAPGILTTLFVPNGDEDDSIFTQLVDLNLAQGINYNSDDTLATLADMLMTVNDNPALSSVGESYGDIGKEFIRESGISVIPAENSAAYEEMKNEIENALRSLPTTGGYNASVEALSAQLVSIAERYNYPITYGKAKLLAISLISYFGSAENITVDGLKEYFGVNSDNTIQNN